MWVLVSGQSFLQTITPHFSQSTVLDQIWSLTLSAEYISLKQIWGIFGSAWQIVLFLCFVRSSKVDHRNQEYSLHWNTALWWHNSSLLKYKRQLKRSQEERDPSNTCTPFADQSLYSGGRDGSCAGKKKKGKKRAKPGLFCPIYVPFCHMVFIGIIVAMGIVAESRIVTFLLPLPLKCAKIR